MLYRYGPGISPKVRLDCPKRLELQKLDKLIHEKISAGRAVRNRPHRFAEQAALDNLVCRKHIQADKALTKLLERGNAGKCFVRGGFVPREN